MSTEVPAEGDPMASETALRIDRSTVISAGSKLLTLVLGGYVVLLTLLGPTWLDSRIRSITDPIAQSMGAIRQTAEQTSATVTKMATKDTADDDISNKTRERVALLESLAIRGREERLANQASVDKRFEQILILNNEIIKSLATVAAKQDMMLTQQRQQGLNIIPRQGG
jgi:hypothetical protein